MSENEFPVEGPRELTSLDNMHLIPGEVFAQTREAIFTLNGRKSYANTACVRMLPGVEYVQYLIDPEEKMFVLKPCDPLDSHSFKWSKEKNGKVYPVQRTGQDFELMICSIMNWDPGDRYQILGRLTDVEYKGQKEPVIAFDLTCKKHFVKSKDGKKAVYDGEWLKKLGPLLVENERSLRVSSFSKYTVMSAEEKRPTSSSETSAQMTASGAQSGGTSTTDNLLPESTEALPADNLLPESTEKPSSDNQLPESTETPSSDNLLPESTADSADAETTPVKDALELSVAEISEDVASGDNDSDAEVMQTSENVAAVEDGQTGENGTAAGGD